MKLDVWPEIVRLFPNRNMPWQYSNAHARFNAAQKFGTALFSEMPVPTQHSYSVLIRLAFAYSALEAVETIYEKDHRKEIRSPIQSPDLAEILRSSLMKDFMAGVALTITSKPLQQSFSDFASGDSNNVRPVVEATRHAVFHGTTSPSRLGLRASKRQTVISLLAKKTLEAANEAFLGLHVIHGVPERYLNN